MFVLLADTMDVLDFYPCLCMTYICSSRDPEAIPASLRPSILLSSKSFDPKLFLSTVHPNATFDDLGRGKMKLKGIVR